MISSAARLLSASLALSAVGSCSPFAKVAGDGGTLDIADGVRVDPDGSVTVDSDSGVDIHIDTPPSAPSVVTAPPTVPPHGEGLLLTPWDVGAPKSAPFDVGPPPFGQIGDCRGNSFTSHEQFSSAIDDFCNRNAGVIIHYTWTTSASYPVLLSDGSHGHVILKFKNSFISPGMRFNETDCRTGLREIIRPGTICYGERDHNVRGAVYQQWDVGTWEGKTDSGPALRGDRTPGWKGPDRPPLEDGNDSEDHDS